MSGAAARPAGRKRIRVAFAALAALLAGAGASAGPAADPAPTGKLADAAIPTACRIDLTVLPDKARFSGHVEIDVTLGAARRSLYLHGRDLAMAKAVAIVGGRTIAATYRQVDPLGVARLDFAAPLPAGPVTLAFDYDAPFNDGPAGLYRVKVGDEYYAWTQFESIDARDAFPSFDQPGYKIPFAISLTTRPGLVAISNAPEQKAVKAGDLVRHVFEPTRPLPTYLVAFDVGPFAVAEGVAPPTPQRATPLPIRILATRAQAGKLDYALRETPRIIALLEAYFGRPFPFPKLDQIASPVMPGAMENAGADTYGDNILLLGANADTAQRQAFGMVVAHELSHQWFGDYVTPAWWDDIWLNESFANWMGYRIGNEWRPELHVGVGAIGEAFQAMGTDALAAGRPIHQPIRTNGEIDSAFDSITYGKGGQVVAMIAAYMGDDRFRDGVRLHMQRHPYGNATSDQFFGALADSAKDPRLLAAMKSFIDRQGVPLVTISRAGNGLVATQSRYLRFGSRAPDETWTIPFCLRRGAARTCALLDRKSQAVSAPGEGAIMPNAGGTGYYRFDLPPAEWDRLIAEAPRLAPGEGLATIDSLWAQFRAGRGAPERLLRAARSAAANPDSDVAAASLPWLSSLRASDYFDGATLADYRRAIETIYKARLDALGFNPAADAYAADDPARQKLREQLVSALAEEARDPALRRTLLDAATGWVAGRTEALDQSYLGAALSTYVEEDRLAGVRKLFEAMLAAHDELVRADILGAIASADDLASAKWIIAALDDPRLRATERVALLGGLMQNPGTRDFAYRWFLAHYDALAKGNGIFAAGALPSLPSGYCSATKAGEIDRALRAKVAAAGQGQLSFDRMIEAIRDCGLLRDARKAEIAAAFRGFR